MQRFLKGILRQEEAGHYVMTDNCISVTKGQKGNSSV